jgi:outer membrane protein assembly factor BamB
MPTGSAIRSVVSNYNSPNVAAAFFESIVQVWNVASATKIAEFATIFEFGGDRVGISADGLTVVAASYGAPGVAAYSAGTGQTLWQRRDIRQLQRLDIDTTGKTVACGFDKQALQILSLETGETLDSLRGVRECHFSPFGSTRLLEKRKLEIHSPNSKPMTIERETFAVLSVTFSEDAFIVSESTGALRCFDLAEGKMRWRYAPLEGSHVLNTGYSTARHEFMAICWPYKTGGKITPLVAFDEQSGAIRREIALETSNDCCFACQGSQLVSSSGWIIDTGTGQLTGSIDVPLKEYRS